MFQSMIASALASSVCAWVPPSLAAPVYTVANHTWHPAAALAVAAPSTPDTAATAATAGTTVAATAAVAVLVAQAST